MLGSEQGVGRQRADQVEAFATQALEAGFDHLDLFPAQVTAFAGVRVESADQDARMGDAELVAQVGVEDARDPGQALVANGVGDLAQRQVGGRQGNAQASSGQHHHHLGGVGEVGEEFGMAGKGDAGFVDHALVHRCGDHPGEVPVEAALAGAGQGFQDVGGVGSVQLPGPDRGGQGRIPYVQLAGLGRSLWPGGRGNVLKVDRQAQLAGALLQERAAGDGDQGWGWAGRASSRHRSGPIPAGSPGVSAKRRLTA